MSDQYQPPKTDLVTEGSFDGTSLLSIHGRLGRIRYLAHSFWVTTLIYTVGYILIVSTESISEPLSGLISIVMLLALATVTFIFTIKRSHDFNASGWWSLLCLIPVVNFFFIFKSGTPTTNRFGSVPPPNTALLWIGGLAAPLVFVLGILAAIAIPSYQDYVARAQIGESMSFTSATRTALAEFYKGNGRWPNDNDLTALNLDKPIELKYSLLYVYPETGVIEVIMSDSPPTAHQIAKGRIVFTPNITNNTLLFDCTSDNIRQRFLSRTCQGSENEH